jgi:ElaA protein
MKKLISSFFELTAEQVYDLMKLRQDVFVIEQNCIYEDFDGYDKKAMHFLIYSEDNLAAYSRIFEPDIKYSNESSIGRIIVSKEYRGGALGKELIKGSIQYCLQEFPNKTIRIEAQAPLKDYYSKLGFRPDSEIYQVDDIDHIQMIYSTTD